MEQEQIRKILAQLVDHEHRLKALEGPGLSSAVKNVTPVISSTVDFSINARAFFKNYSPSLSGPKRFVLVLAYMTQGQLGQQKTLEEISSQWGSVEGLLGGKMQMMYATRAKEQDWIDSPKKSVYVLRPKWPEILSHQNQ